MKWISTSRHDLAVHLLTCCEILIEIKSNFVLCLFSFMKHMKMKVVVPVLPSLCQKIWQMVTSITRKKCINLGLCDVLSTDLEGTTLILVTSLPSPWRSVHNKIFLFSILQFACNCCVQQRKYNGILKHEYFWEGHVCMRGAAYTQQFIYYMWLYEFSFTCS